MDFFMRRQGKKDKHTSGTEGHYGAKWRKIPTSSTEITKSAKIPTSRIRKRRDITR
jgi:hypothetical protein